MGNVRLVVACMYARQPALDGKRDSSCLQSNVSTMLRAPADDVADPSLEITTVDVWHRAGGGSASWLQNERYLI